MDEGEHIKEVYAHFGLAVYLAQCLEQAIFNHLLFFDFFPKNAPVFKGKKHWQKQFDLYEAQELGKTMGQLINRLKTAGQPTDEIKAILTDALARRNRLAHRYFAENAVLFMSEAGRNAMLDDLEMIQTLFRMAAEKLDEVTTPVAEKYGLSEEKLKRTMEDMLSQKSM